MSDSTKNRKSHTSARPSSPEEAGGIQKSIDELPARLWFAIGFVGFFFAIGAWNQLSSTWTKITGDPILGAGQPVGLLVGFFILLVSVGLGFRAWLHDRREIRDSRSPDWKSDLTRHSDDIRFP